MIIVGMARSRCARLKQSLQLKGDTVVWQLENSDNEAFCGYLSVTIIELMIVGIAGSRCAKLKWL